MCAGSGLPPPPPRFLAQACIPSHAPLEQSLGRNSSGEPSCPQPQPAHAPPDAMLTVSEVDQIVFQNLLESRNVNTFLVESQVIYY